MFCDTTAEYCTYMDAQAISQALNLNQVENGSIIAIIACVLLILVILKFVSSVITRIVMSIVFAALGIGIYSQRASVIDCAKKVTDQVTSEQNPVVAGSADSAITCTFFGQDVAFSVPNS